MSNSIQLRPNIPVHLALLSPESEMDSRYDGIEHFTTTAGLLTVSSNVAEQINALELRTGEQFSICKQVEGRSVRYDIGLANDAERGRAIEEAEDPELMEATLRRTRRPEIVQSQPVRRRPVARAERPQIETRGTGTHGPAPQPAKAPPRTAFQPIPYNVAFREVTQFVTAELKATGEQWADQAKQDLISTILISAQKRGLLKIWERENG